MNSRLSVADLVVGWQSLVVAALGTFEINSGSIVVLAGRNGAGKSTALKTIAKQIAAISGTVTLDDQNIEDLSAAEFAKKVAYVPQTLDLPGQLTVKELVALGRNPHQKWWSWQTDDADKTAIASALTRTNLTQLQNKTLGTLSGGEKQRAIVAVALAQQSHFILLDEPTAHLDFRHQLEFVSLLHELRSQGLGLLVVLHDLNLMAKLADEIVLLKREADQPATVVSKGPSLEVLQAGPLRIAYGVEVAIITDTSAGITTYAPIKPASA